MQNGDYISSQYQELNDLSDGLGFVFLDTQNRKVDIV